jgi:hypothetical protein
MTVWYLCSYHRQLSILSKCNLCLPLQSRATAHTRYAFPPPIARSSYTNFSKEIYSSIPYLLSLLIAPSHKKNH